MVYLTIVAHINKEDKLVMSWAKEQLYIYSGNLWSVQLHTNSKDPEQKWSRYTTDWTIKKLGLYISKDGRSVQFIPIQKYKCILTFKFSVEMYVAGFSTEIISLPSLIVWALVHNKS